MYLLASIRQTCCAEGCTRSNLQNAIHGGEDPQSEDTWPINKTFEKPIGDNELKRSVFAGNDSRLKNQEKMMKRVIPL